MCLCKISYEDVEHAWSSLSLIMKRDKDGVFFWFGGNSKD